MHWQNRHRFRLMALGAGIRRRRKNYTAIAWPTLKGRETLKLEATVERSIREQAETGLADVLQTFKERGTAKKDSRVHARRLAYSLHPLTIVVEEFFSNS